MVNLTHILVQKKLNFKGLQNDLFFMAQKSQVRLNKHKMYRYIKHKALADMDESLEGFCSHRCSHLVPSFLFPGCSLSLVVWDVVRVLVALNHVAVAGLVLCCEGLHRSGCDIVGPRLKCQQRSARQHRSQRGTSRAVMRIQRQSSLETKDSVAKAEKPPSRGHQQPKTHHHRDLHLPPAG